MQKLLWKVLVRFLDKEVGEFIVERMNDIVTSTAKLFRGEAELIELSSVPPLTNDDKLAHEVTELYERYSRRKSSCVI